MCFGVGNWSGVFVYGGQKSDLSVSYNEMLWFGYITLPAGMNPEMQTGFYRSVKSETIKIRVTWIQTLPCSCMKGFHCSLSNPLDDTQCGAPSHSLRLGHENENNCQYQLTLGIVLGFDEDGVYNFGMTNLFLRFPILNQREWRLFLMLDKKWSQIDGLCPSATKSRIHWQQVKKNRWLHGTGMWKNNKSKFGGKQSPTRRKILLFLSYSSGKFRMDWLLSNRWGALDSVNEPTQMSGLLLQNWKT